MSVNTWPSQTTSHSIPAVLCSVLCTGAGSSPGSSGGRMFLAAGMPAVFLQLPMALSQESHTSPGPQYICAM